MILSIDASTHSTGIAVFEEKNLIEYKCITSSSTDLIKRIKIMIEGIANILKEYNISEIIIEEIRFDNKNPKVMKALSWLQAGIVFYLYENYPNIKITYVYPNEWRKKCNIKTGKIKREEQKKESIRLVKELFNLEVNDDISEAILIGYSACKDWVWGG